MKAGDVARGGRKGHRLQLQLRMQRAGTLLRSECRARQRYWGAPRQSVGQSGGPVPSSVASASPLPCDDLLQPPDTRSIPLSPPPSRRRTRATDSSTLFPAPQHCSLRFHTVPHCLHRTHEMRPLLSRYTWCSVISLSTCRG